MHNVELSPAINEASSYRNLLGIEEAVNSIAYNYWIPARDFEAYVSTFVPVYYQAGRSWTAEPAHWELGKVGGNVSVTTYIRRLPSWRNGHLVARFHVGVDILGGNNLWGVAFNPVYDSVAFTDGYSVGMAAAPTVLNTINVIEPRGTATNFYCRVAPDVIGVLLRLQRRPTHAIDTNLGDIRLYGAEIAYLEGSRYTGTTFTPSSRLWA